MDSNPLLLDVDRTVTNLVELQIGLSKKVSELVSIDPENYNYSFDEYIRSLENSRDFDPEDFIKNLTETYGVDEEELRKIIFETPEIYQNALYPEVLDVVSELFARGVQIGVYTEGKNEAYQRDKFAPLLDYLDDNLIFYFENKLSEEALVQIPDGATIVDDKRVIIEELLKTGRFNLVWLNRNDDEVHPDPRVRTIHSLNELLTVEYLQ